MAKVFTQEERKKLRDRLLHSYARVGAETLRQLEAKTGATRYLISVLCQGVGCEW